MAKTAITAVSYLNTIPFVYGLKHAACKGDFALSLDVPAECARKLTMGEADAGLLPVAAWPLIQDRYSLMNHCIAADGAVASVLLLSRVPLHKIQSVELDADSRTSVELIRVLADEYWNIQPDWIPRKIIAQDQRPESLLAIGDKAFGLVKEYPYCYDLAAEWRRFTGLPFVFAVWVIRREASVEQRDNLHKALATGVEHISEAIAELGHEHPTSVDVFHYLSRHIRFDLDAGFRQGMELFLKKLAAR